ncbi:MAG: NAD(P)H-dependent oxidoreductase [Thermoplasmata archaeon]|jgi:chromate reductase
MSELKFLGVPGSLRKNAYSLGLLHAAVELAPKEVRIDIADIHGFPVFNQDEEQNAPEPVHVFREKVRTADAILFSINEHNYSLSAAEKNALDWGSRPYTDNVWNGKPAGIMSASIGMIGGARAQYDLRRSMVFLNIFPINRPEVMVPFAADKFDGNGRLTDANTKKIIGNHLAELVRFTRVLKHEH